MSFDLPSFWTALAVALPTLAIAYVIFGITGFGTALIAAPVLAQVMPVATMALLLVPAMLLGLYVGHRITLRMSREQFIRVLGFVLIVTGTSLAVRALGFWT